MIAVIGGSFNPPTISHINLSKYILKNLDISKVIYVPVGDQYRKKGLINSSLRIDMLNLALQNEKNIEVSDIETTGDNVWRTVETLEEIQKQYPNEQIAFVMGADKLIQIHKWKRNEDLLSNFKFIVFNRGNYNVENIISINKKLNKYKNNFIIVNNENDNISSTLVRNNIKENKSISGLVNPLVEDFISKNNLYR